MFLRVDILDINASKCHLKVFSLEKRSDILFIQGYSCECLLYGEKVSVIIQLLFCHFTVLFLGLVYEFGQLEWFGSDL